MTLNFQDHKKAVFQEWEGRLMWDEKGYESIGHWTHYVTLSYDLDLPANFEKAISQGWEDWHWTKGVQVNTKSDPLCDLGFLTASMTLTLDFKGQILKNLYLKNWRVD